MILQTTSRCIAVCVARGRRAISSDIQPWCHVEGADLSGVGLDTLPKNNSSPKKRTVRFFHAENARCFFLLEVILGVILEVLCGEFRGVLWWWPFLLIWILWFSVIPLDTLGFNISWTCRSLLHVPSASQKNLYPWNFNHGPLRSLWLEHFLFEAITRCWQLNYALFSPRKLGKIPNLTNIFQRGWNHQLDYIFLFGIWGPCNCYWGLRISFSKCPDMSGCDENHSPTRI